MLTMVQGLTTTYAHTELGFVSLLPTNKQRAFKGTLVTLAKKTKQTTKSTIIAVIFTGVADTCLEEAMATKKS